MWWVILLGIIAAAFYAYRVSSTIKVKTPSCSSCASKKTFNDES